MTRTGPIAARVVAALLRAATHVVNAETARLTARLDLGNPCRCLHPADTHTHYRPGLDCGHHGCGCTRYRPATNRTIRRLRR